MFLKKKKRVEQSFHTDEESLFILLKANPWSLLQQNSSPVYFARSKLDMVQA